MCHLLGHLLIQQLSNGLLESTLSGFQGQTRGEEDLTLSSRGQQPPGERIKTKSDKSKHIRMESRREVRGIVPKRSGRKHWVEKLRSGGSD